MTTSTSTNSAAALNRECLCTTINPAALERELAAALGDNDLYRSIRETRPHLFSATAVFVTPEQVNKMRTVIEAVEAVGAGLSKLLFKLVKTSIKRCT